MINNKNIENGIYNKKNMSNTNQELPYSKSPNSTFYYKLFLKIIILLVL